jgi:hypothetical protein
MLRITLLDLFAVTVFIPKRFQFTWSLLVKKIREEAPMEMVKCLSFYNSSAVFRVRRSSEKLLLFSLNFSQEVADSAVTNLLELKAKILTGLPSVEYLV